MDQSWLLENSEKVGIIGILAFNVVCLLKGWLVPQWVHKSITDECTTLRNELRAANERDRHRLERVDERLDDILDPRKSR